MNDSNARLQQLIDKESQKGHTHGVVLGAQSADGRIDFQGAAGSASPDSPYFIASVSKTYTVAVLMQLVDEGRLDLDAPITDYLSPDMLAGIHVYQGTDYSHQLKIYQLIHQTSGLADYFEGHLAEDFKQNVDHEYSVEDTLAIARGM
ncbi:MAG: beta-lactamase family protein, partial [Anaerolineae bacterium]|nr:beta-lactamase family protein [Anaerolineae bacterium]